MLKFSVGYQYNDESFFDAVSSYLYSIEEIYFSWIDMPSGRPTVSSSDEYFEYSLQERLLGDLKKFKQKGIKLDLLFNANCYGADAISQTLKSKVYSVIDYLKSQDLMPEIVTTTSPFIAQMVKERYKGIELRASVNMKIGSIKGMQYLAHVFDSFCIAKECNRDIETLTDISNWAKANGKKIVMLANSGCMRNCSGQIFHDNMIAHESEISCQDNVKMTPYACWNYLKNKENFVSVLQNTWIRPEDIDNYEGFVDVVKLATRAHRLPAMVIGSYARRRYLGNLLDLFEPGFSPAFMPYVIDSTKIPKDFWQQTTSCNKKCEKCSYCSQVLQDALVYDE